MHGFSAHGKAGFPEIRVHFLKCPPQGLLLDSGQVSQNARFLSLEFRKITAKNEIISRRKERMSRSSVVTAYVAKKR